MKKLVLLLLAFMPFGLALNAQTVDELKAMKADKEAAAAAILAEIADLDTKINTFPGWKVGGLGILGFDLNQNNAWYALDNPTSRANGYGLNFTAFANLDQEKLFWRNALLTNLKQVNTTIDGNFDNDLDDTEDTELKAITDALDISSLAGYKLTEKFAISAEGKFLSSLLNFNNPGKLQLSAGATWTPIPNLVVLIHPLGYEFNWPSEDFTSVAGAKIGASYAAEIIPGVAWTSNLSAFLPYGGDDTREILGVTGESGNWTAGDLSNWTWINGFTFSVFKGIGVGVNLGLRSDKQLINNFALSRQPVTQYDNKLSSYYSVGLSYTL